MYRNAIKLSLVVLCVIFATIIGWFTNNQSLIGIDDANIYMVYMKNFADGYGFVYNAGGERVEGFTSLLWTLIGGLAFFISSKPEIVLLFINIALISYSLWQLVCYVDNHFADSRLITPASLMVLGILVVIPGYFEWTVLTLMETGLWSALLILITLNLLKEKSDSRFAQAEFILLIVLLVICRPESLLWGAGFVFAKFLKSFFIHGRFVSAVLSALPGAIAFFGAIVALILWRESYFGFPLPNTYYAKVSADILANIVAGVEYNLKSFLFNPVILISFLLVVANLYTVFTLKNDYTKYRLLLIGAIVGVALMIPLYTGGDHFGLSRFLQPVVPLMLIAVLFNLKLLGVKPNYSLAIGAIVFFTFVNQEPIYKNILKQDSPISYEWLLSVEGRERSALLQKFFEKNTRLPSQGVRAAGGSAYGYDGVTVDLLALNNVEMAHAEQIKNPNAPKNHASFNKDVFFKQRPEIVWIGSRFVENDQAFERKITPAAVNIMLNVHQDPRFKASYSAVLIENNTLDYSLMAFVLNDFLESLDASIYSYEPVVYE